MDIYLWKNGLHQGPYSESEIMARLKSGSCTKTDLAWCDGCTEPLPLLEILCQATPNSIPTAKVFSPEELAVVGESYKTLFAVAIIWLVGLFIPMSPSFERIWATVITGFWIRPGWRLYRVLGRKPWLWVVWSLIPVANIYVLVRILWTAARILKANGIPYGIIDNKIALPFQRRTNRSLSDASRTAPKSFGNRIAR